jgi:hypothetical protein
LLWWFPFPFPFTFQLHFGFFFQVFILFLLLFRMFLLLLSSGFRAHSYIVSSHSPITAGLLVRGDLDFSERLFDFLQRMD